MNKEVFLCWYQVDNLMTRARATDKYRETISSVRQPLGILFSIITNARLQKEQRGEQDDVWIPHHVRAAAEQIKMLIYGHDETPRGSVDLPTVTMPQSYRSEPAA